MKRIIVTILCAVLIFEAFCLSASAQEISESSVRIDYPDGSYCIQTIVVERSNSPFFTAASTKAGTKSSRYYSASNVLQFTVTVRGTFSYNGTSATATSAQYGYSISDNAWSFVSGSASCSGATATATCKFRSSPTASKTLSVSLTCSPTGVLS